MKDIASKLPLEQIEKELTPDKFLRNTNKGGNHIYIVTAQDSPSVMHEIGRLRELTFRQAGGGTGKDLDIDNYDTSDKPYKQLIVWDPDAKEILGGYRYILGNELEFHENGEPCLATARIFKFSDKFISDYLPYTIELGRSFVQPDYQTTKAGAKALYALDNLWDGLGALIIDNPDMKYFFGKVTMYTHFNIEARNYLLGYLNIYFKDQESLVYPKPEYKLSIDFSLANQAFTHNDIKADYKILSKQVREHGENIPPLINAYMNLSPTMRVFGTTINDRFGDVEETGIIVTIKDMYAAKINRHLDSYVQSNKSQFLFVNR